MSQVSIGECANADPFELALTLSSGGLRVKEIFATVNEENLWYLKALSDISPDTKVYCNQDPSMISYEEKEGEVCLTLGKDAAYYHPKAAHVTWNRDVQPYGFAAVRSLVREMDRALQSHTAAG